MNTTVALRELDKLIDSNYKKAILTADLIKAGEQVLGDGESLSDLLFLFHGNHKYLIMCHSFVKEMDDASEHDPDQLLIFPQL